MNQPRIQNVSGILIAGGKSRRMGQDKRFLRVGQKSLFRRTLEVLTATFTETIVVLAEPVAALDVQGCRVVYDQIPNAGSLGGLYTGLVAATKPRVFAVACDMPFLESKVIRSMISCDESADVVVAELSGRFQPMHAVYSQRCRPFLKTMAEQRDLKIQKLFRQGELRITVVDTRHLGILESGLRSFENINTPDDLVRAEASPSE